MKKQVLFLHCAGPQGPHTGSDDLVAGLKAMLGTHFRVRYPRMPDLDDPRYQSWKAQLEKELATVNDPVILVGHSLGGSVLLKYLSEVDPPKAVAGVCIVAAPFWGQKGWKSRDFALRKDRSKLGQIPRLFFFHSHDDEVVPFSHVNCYAEIFPDATIRELNGFGHLFTNGCAALADEIKRLGRKPPIRKRFRTPISQGA